MRRIANGSSPRRTPVFASWERGLEGRCGIALPKRQRYIFPLNCIGIDHFALIQVLVQPAREKAAGYRT
jgi:hypothetical protein